MLTDLRFHPRITVLEIGHGVAWVAPGVTERSIRKVMTPRHNGETIGLVFHWVLLMPPVRFFVAEWA